MSAYNGWTNRETWLVSIWIDNEQQSYNYWREQAAFHRDQPSSSEYWTREESAKFGLAADLRTYFGESNPLVGQASFWNDLMVAALANVEWNEIAENLLAE